MKNAQTGILDIDVECLDTSEMTEDEFRGLRSTGIGGTDVPAILGVNPWKREFQLFMEKKGILDHEPENAAMEEGKDYEPILAAEYLRRHPDRRLFRSLYKRHPRVEFLFGNVDGLVVNGGQVPISVFEAKRVGERSPLIWPENRDSQDIPAMYYCQVQTYMEIFDLPIADVLVKLPGLKKANCPEYVIRRDKKFFADVLEVLQDWHVKFLRDEPPPIDGSDAAKQFLRYRFPEETEGKVIVAAEDIGVLLDELIFIKADMKGKEARRAELQNIICAAMGDADTITWPGGKAYYRRKKGSPEWKAIAVAAGANPELIAAHTPAFTDRYLTTYPGKGGR